MERINKPPVIDHAPHEFTARKTAGIWWGPFALLAVIWGLTWILRTPIDWRSMALGRATVAIVLSWAYDITGGKVPASWRRKPPSQ